MPSNPFAPYPRGKGAVKAFLFGDPGTEKTRRALSLPGPRYMIDLEKGADEYGDLTESGDQYLSCQSYRMFCDAVDFVVSLRDRATVIVDPAGQLWEILQTGMAIKRARTQSKGDKQTAPEDVIFDQGIWGRLNRSHNDPFTKLINSPHHLVLIARGKALKNKEGDVIGYGWEGHKSLPYIVKTVIETHADHDIVKKDRSGTFREGRTSRVDLRKLLDSSGTGTGVSMQTASEAGSVDGALAWDKARPHFEKYLASLNPQVAIGDFESFMAKGNENGVYDMDRDELIAVLGRLKNDTDGIRSSLFEYVSVVGT